MRGSRCIAFAVVSSLACGKGKPPSVVVSPAAVASARDDTGAGASSPPATAGEETEDYNLGGYGVITVDLVSDAAANGRPTPVRQGGAFVPVRGNTGLRFATPRVDGRLPPEVIQRIVQQGSAPLRKCYEASLRRDPKLAGRIVIAFTIDRSGSPEAVNNAESSVHDEALVACAVLMFRSLSYPEPEGGIVKVQYPITFDPGASPP